MSEIDWQSLQLTLTASKTTVPYRGLVTLTARLADYAATADKSPSIYRTPYGGTENAGCNRYRRRIRELLNHDTTREANDVFCDLERRRPTPRRRHQSLDRSARASHNHRASLRLHATSGHYRLYRYHASCTHTHANCPLYAGAVTPNHARLRAFFTLQVNASGRWRTLLHSRRRSGSPAEPLRDSSTAGPVSKSTPTRIHTRFKGDADHLGSTSPWSYLKVPS